MPFYEQFIINFDGSLEYKYQNISIAYYIEVFEEHNDKNAYDILIDKNNQLYYLYRTDEKLEDKKLENKNIKIKNIVIDNKNDNKYLPNIKITLEDNDVIEFN